MHELSIAESILDIVKESLGENSKQKLLNVTVEIGELTAVIPESLKFCFETIVENTPYKGAELHIRNIALSGECKKCGNNFQVHDYFFCCPVCQSNEVKVTHGQELNVTELEVE